MKRPTICGVSAISGTSTIAPRPCCERRLGRAQVDLGLARAGHAVQQTLRAQRAPSAPARSDVEHRAAARRVSSGGWGERAPTARCGVRLTARRLRPLSRRAAPGGSTSAERARDRRAVLRRDPFGQRDQLAGHAQLQRAQRRQQLLRRRPRWSRRGRRPPRAPRGGRTARRASSRRRRRRRAAPRAAGSRTARAARGPSSSARPGRWRTSAGP